ncbi:MAG: AI-2E family transporter [Balneolaceae bacterium]
MKNTTERWYVKYTIILVGAILTVFAMIEAKSILQTLLFAFFFSVLLSPICTRLERYKIPRLLSAFVAILLGMMVFAGVGFFFYTQLTAFTGDIDIFRERFDEILATVQSFLSTRFGIDNFIDFDQVRTSVLNFFSDNTDTLLSRVADAASVFSTIFLVPVFMFLILIFRDFLKEFVLKAFGNKSIEEYKRVETIIDKVKVVVQDYIAGVLIVITILAVLNSIMLTVIGVEHALFFGVFAAMLNVIPFVGPMLGSVLPVLYALFTMDSLFYPLIILLGFYVIQLFEGNLFTPVIVGSKVSMNALAALLLLFIGAQIWGLVGMILFIPLGAMMKVIFDEVESLHPYGFVMGRVPKEPATEGKLAKRISSFSEKIIKQKETDSDKTDS